MTNLIDDTFFYGKLYVAQKSDQAVNETLNAYIVQYEAEYMLAVLGSIMYNDMYVTSPRPQYMTDLVNGKTFTDSYGNTINYTGLVKNNVSPIANYVYCKYMQDNSSFTTAAGEKVNNVQSTTAVSSSNKICSVWNEMANQTRNLVEFMLANSTVYTLPREYDYIKRWWRPYLLWSSVVHSWQEYSILRDLISKLNPVF